MAAGKSNPTQAPVGREFVITRVFNAPRELVWKAWTERERLMQWFGPKGVTMRVATLDFRPGGVFHYCMRTLEGREILGIGVYREIVAPSRLVYIDSFADAHGNPSPAGALWHERGPSAGNLGDGDLRRA